MTAPAIHERLDLDVASLVEPERIDQADAARLVAVASYFGGFASLFLIRVDSVAGPIRGP